MSDPPRDDQTPGECHDLVVAGGGAAGFFAAITASEAAPGLRVLILEKTREVLGKVRISGGGRCNVTHACFEPKVLVTHYPRGAKQLIGPFHHWGPAETMAWFEGRGVPLKVEADGRVFPQSDSSQSIMDCLTRSARDAAVEVRTSTALEDVLPLEGGGFEIRTADGGRMHARGLLLATGGTRNRLGADIAQTLGHRVEAAAPSLFTFKIEDSRLLELQGLSVPVATIQVVGERSLSATGPVLITHWGLSGPGILRLSAWGARELQQRDYRFEIVVNWCGDLREEEVLQRFAAMRTDSPKKKVVNEALFGIPARLWKRLVIHAAGEARAGQLQWPQLDKASARGLAQQLTACRLQVEGKSMNKDEFVTCGGVHLPEVDFRTMESRRVPGLHFAGEILDLDGITGGFNFQAAWATGRLAGEAIAERLGHG